MCESSPFSASVHRPFSLRRAASTPPAKTQPPPITPSPASVPRGRSPQKRSARSTGSRASSTGRGGKRSKSVDLAFRPPGEHEEAPISTPKVPPSSHERKLTWEIRVGILVFFDFPSSAHPGTPVMPHRPHEQHPAAVTPGAEFVPGPIYNPDYTVRGCLHSQKHSQKHYTRMVCVYVYIYMCVCVCIVSRGRVCFLEHRDTSSVGV